MPRVEIYLDNLIRKIDYAKVMLLVNDTLEYIQQLWFLLSIKNNLKVRIK